MRRTALRGSRSGLASEHLLGADDLEAARVVRVGRVGLRVPLLAGEPDLLGIDDDDELAGVDVRRVFGAVLAAQDVGDLDRQPADDLVGGVDDEPISNNCFFLGHRRRHKSLRQKAQRLSWAKRIS